MDATPTALVVAGFPDPPQSWTEGLLLLGDLRSDGWHGQETGPQPGSRNQQARELRFPV